MRKGTPAPAIYGGSQCRLRLRGGLKAMPLADTNLIEKRNYRRPASLK
jgi:hypothetical protein